MTTAFLSHVSISRTDPFTKASRNTQNAKQSEFTLGTLYSDRCGYFSFDLAHFGEALAVLALAKSGPPSAAATPPTSPVISDFLDKLYLACLEGGREKTLTLLDRKERKDSFSALAQLSLPLTHNIFINPKLVKTCCDGKGASNVGLSIQNPDILDWEISPNSFVTRLTGTKQCGPNDAYCQPFAHSTFPVNEYFFHRITDVIPPESGRPGTTAFETIMPGKIKEYKQTWTPLGHALGDIIYSFTLAPCETMNLAVIDWSRKDSAQRLDDIEYDESLQHYQAHDRTIDDIVNATLEEEQSGWSVMGGVGAGEKVSGSASATVPIEGVPVNVSSGLGFGVLGFIGGGYASSSGRRALAGTETQNIADTVVQKSNLLRRMRSTVIVQATQEEHSTLQTRAISNHNHCHALTLQYYEVIRHLKVTTEYVGTRDVVFVPFPLQTFTEDSLLQFGYIFRRTLLDPHLQKCLTTVLDKCKQDVAKSRGRNTATR